MKQAYGSTVLLPEQPREGRGGDLKGVSQKLCYTELHRFKIALPLMLLHITKGFLGGSFSRPAGGSCCWGGVIAEGAAEHPRVTGMLSKPEGSQQKSSRGCCISLPFAGAGGDSTVTAEQHQPLPARSHHVLPCLLL